MGLLVYIVDDHQLFADALASVVKVSQPAARVECFANAAAALAAVKTRAPDLALLDLNIPGLNGFALMQQLTTVAPLCSVVVVSASLASDDMRRALKEGAAGYIPKSASTEIIQSALQLVLAGGVYLPPEMLQLGERAAPASKSAVECADTHSELTPRQLQVLAFLVRGWSNKKIANELNCAETTVKAHVAAILRILNVANRTEAVFIAKQKGYAADL